MAGIFGGSLFYRLAWVFYLLLALAGALWIGWRVGPIGLGTFVDPESWWIDAGCGAAAGLALLAVWEAARRSLATARRLESELARLLGTLELPEVVALALLSGFAEELFFRGAVQGAWGWLPATLLFTLVHTGPGKPFRLWTAFAAIAGVTLAWLTIWRGNLLAPIVAHAMVNGVNLGRLVRGGGPERPSPGAAEGLLDSPSAGNRPEKE